MTKNTTHTLTVDEASQGQRLDKFLSTALPDFSRARLQKLIEEGAVVRGQPLPLRERQRGLTNASELSRSGEGVASEAVNLHPPSPKPSPAGGEGFPPASASPSRITHHPPLTASTKTKAGETYTLTIPETVALDLTPAPEIKIDVVYEDEDILILNKQAGLTVHPAAGTKNDTLVHALIAHCGATLSGIGGVARPGIVHRIDKDTSGLLVVAKTDRAHHSLSAQLKDHTLCRTYIAFCWGALTPRTGCVDAPIARNPRNRKAMAVVKDGKHARTHYETLEAYHTRGNIMPLASKVVCELETGRTHQIRVHLTHLKCPLMGDPVYGASTAQRLQRLCAAGYQLTPEVTDVFKGFRRQALHAFGLRLVHPKTQETLEFECPLPEDLIALEATLAAISNKNALPDGVRSHLSERSVRMVAPTPSQD